MKKIIIISISLSATYSLTAQSIQRSVIGSAGKVSTGGAYKISATVGEAATTRYAIASGLKLNQGFQQLYTIGTTLPVLGLEFYAKRLNSTTVQLDWKTIQEINNKGFYIERKKENEGSFVPVGFVNSNATGGNSSFSIQYQKLDNNNFTGNTYYRLKQEDIDDRSTYSVVRIVKGDPSKQLTMQVWPVPSVGFFNVSVSGLAKTDMLQVIDMSGRLIKQFAIQDQTQLQISGLPAGTYFVKLVSDKSVGQKVIVQ